MKDKLFRRLFYVASVVVVACVIASSVISQVTASISEGYIENGQVSKDYVTMTYVLSCKGDKVAGFVKGEDEPFIETDTPVSSLPYDLQERLREGIEYRSEKELRKAILEYCS